MTSGIRKVGNFCWINMLTPRPAEAREFFGKLLGWQYAEIPGVGHRAQVGGRDIGGVFDLDSPQTPPGTPPLIGAMVKVASADETCARVTALGGTCKPAFDVMDQGRMAVCFDPNGAEFDVWEARNNQGTDADSSLHGAPSWFETITTDVDPAAKFYAALFGWTPEALQLPGWNYTTFKHAGTLIAGMMHMGNMPPAWWTYFTVDDIEETVHDAVALGGKIHLPVKEVPGIGRLAFLASPQGVTFYVMQYAMRASGR